MPLTGKYLKYSPEITLEIFTLVWDKLIKNGCKFEYSKEIIFDRFKFHNRVLRYDSNGNYVYPLMGNNSCKETTVQEILGYDPFDKEFILPDKWCIKTTKDENGKLIGKWFDKQSMCRCYHDTCLGEYYNSYNLLNESIILKGNLAASFASLNVKEGYTEITFDQFKKYVLKESIEELKIMEKDWSKATEKELLEEAKRKYPIGCKFISFSGNEVVCKEIWHVDYNNQVWIKGSGAYNGICFNNGKWAKITFLPKTKVENKEIIPEYVECVDSTSQNPTGIENGKIYKILSKINCNCKNDSDIYLLDCLGASNKTCWDCNKSLPDNAYRASRLKPSTKEAFDVQNKSKSIEKWSVGSYGVVINSTNKRFPIGFIDKIIPATSHKKVKFENYYSYDPGNLEYSSGLEFKWFATKAEAEEFAKTLVEPVKHGNGIINIIELREFPKEGYCKTDRIELRDYLKNKFPQYTQKSWQSKYTIVAWNETGYWWCEEKSSKPEYQLNQLEKFFTKEEVKQPLKQAVHCKTQEEWDFVTEKLGNDGENWFKHAGWGNNKSFCISFEGKNQSQTLDFYQKGNYQILSFQEWCDLNGYKMESNQKFKDGDWIVYYIESKNSHINSFKLNDIIQVINGKANNTVPFIGVNDITNCFRHATPEEIQLHVWKNCGNAILSNSSYGIGKTSSIERLDKSLSIFPTFEEKPSIKITEFEEVTKDYFINFKDPYN